MAIDQYDLPKGLRHWYYVPIDLNGKDAHKIMDGKLASSGACSLRMLLAIRANTTSKEQFDSYMEKVIAYDNLYNEPVTYLAYFEDNGGSKKILEDYGFALLEYLPGGHGPYVMCLMSWTARALTYATPEEKRVANEPAVLEAALVA